MGRVPRIDQMKANNSIRNGPGGAVRTTVQDSNAQAENVAHLEHVARHLEPELWRGMWCPTGLQSGTCVPAGLGPHGTGLSDFVNQSLINTKYFKTKR